MSESQDQRPETESYKVYIEHGWTPVAIGFFVLVGVLGFMFLRWDDSKTIEMFGARSMDMVENIVDRVGPLQIEGPNPVTSTTATPSTQPVEFKSAVNVPVVRPPMQSSEQPVPMRTHSTTRPTTVTTQPTIVPTEVIVPVPVSTTLPTEIPVLQAPKNQVSSTQPSTAWTEIPLATTQTADAVVPQYTLYGINSKGEIKLLEDVPLDVIYTLPDGKITFSSSIASQTEVSDLVLWSNGNIYRSTYPQGHRIRLLIADKKAKSIDIDGNRMFVVDRFTYLPGGRSGTFDRYLTPLVKVIPN